MVVIQSKYFCASANDPCPRLQGCSLKFSLVAEFIQLWPFYEIVFHMSLSKGKLFVNIVRYKFLVVFAFFVDFLLIFKKFIHNHIVQFGMFYFLIFLRKCCIGVAFI